MKVKDFYKFRQMARESSQNILPPFKDVSSNVTKNIVKVIDEFVKRLEVKAVLIEEENEKLIIIKKTSEKSSLRSEDVKMKAVMTKSAEHQQVIVLDSCDESDDAASEDISDVSLQQKIADMTHIDSSSNRDLLTQMSLQLREIHRKIDATREIFATDSDGDNMDGDADELIRIDTDELIEHLMEQIIQLEDKIDANVPSSSTAKSETEIVKKCI